MPISVHSLLLLLFLAGVVNYIAVFFRCRLSINIGIMIVGE